MATRTKPSSKSNSSSSAKQTSTRPTKRNGQPVSRAAISPVSIAGADADAGAEGLSNASDERKLFAKNLRLTRRAIEMSQEEMALIAGMSRSYASGVERGERNITVDNMARLAKVLEVSLFKLLDPAYVPVA